MGIRVRFMIATGVLATIAILVVAVASYELSRRSALRDAKEKGRIIFTTMEAIQNNFMSAQRPLLLQVVEKDRFYPELMSGAVITRMVWDHLDKSLGGYRFKQAALDARWQPNQADEHEAGMIEAFRSDPALKSQEGFVTRKGEPAYFFATRRNTGKGCLQCHGEAASAPKDQLEIYGSERGYGWKEGTVNAAFVVYVPVGQALAEARANALRLLAVAAGVLALALAGIWLLLDRSVVAPIVALTARTEGISLARGLEEKVATRGKGELATLAQAIERLRVSMVKVLRRGA
jgi:hypothetical protein